MTAQIIRGREVTRPTPERLTSTILDVATVVEYGEGESWGLTNNEGLWPSYNCLDTLVPTPTCANPSPQTFKEFNVAPWVPGFEFAVHGGVRCRAIGLDQRDQIAELTRVFERNEAKGVEMALLLNRFADASEEPGSDDALNPGADGVWDAPVDLGSITTLAGAVAALEGYAAANYAGVPTLHLPRAALTPGFGAGLFTKEGDRFYTKAGSKIAAGGGYDDQPGKAAGVYDLFVTGEVYVEKSSGFSRQEIVHPGDGSGVGSDENGIPENSVIALAERMFRIGVDCLVAQATTTIYTVS